MRFLTGFDGTQVQHFQFRFGLDVEAVNACGKRIVHFGDRLADAREHDAVCRNASRQCAA